MYNEPMQNIAENGQQALRDECPPNEDVEPKETPVVVFTTKFFSCSPRSRAVVGPLPNDHGCMAEDKWGENP